MLLFVFSGLFMAVVCCLRQPWKYYENTNGEKVRTLLAGYTFTGFALLCFQTVTSLACSAGGFGGLSSGLPLFWIHYRLGELGRE